MATVPPEALALSPRRWTDEEIRETYERVCKEPVDYRQLLPPKLERKYIVVGGSGEHSLPGSNLRRLITRLKWHGAGLVGGDIILQLLQRGQSPESIRVLDFNLPSRSDLTRGSAANVDFVKVDITDATWVTAAFTKAWPASVSDLALTVFHVAAAIRIGEHSLLHWERSRRVNVDGTANILSAAKTAGADIFIATSSASLSVRPVRFFFAPWRPGPTNLVQICDEQDFYQPLRRHEEFFGNYAHSKAIAERMVCDANAPGFRVGVIRPGNGIYGAVNDTNLGKGLTRDRYASINSFNIQSFVSGWNVSLAHLDLEAALLGRGTTATSPTGLPKCSGRPFVITDNGPAPQWTDCHRAVALLRVPPSRGVEVSPLPVYLLSFVLEWWCLLLAWFPVLTRAPFHWGEPVGEWSVVRPNVFTNIHACMFCVDTAARRSVEDGGIGYRGGNTTLEGVCELIRNWNEEWSRAGKAGSDDSGREESLKADVVPVPTTAA